MHASENICTRLQVLRLRIKPCCSFEINLRFFTERVAELWAVPDTTRLVVLNLQTLEYRRVFCDLVLLHSKTKVDLPNIFQLNSNSITRGHTVKLFKCHRSLDCAKYYFSNRVTTLWNKLHSKVVLATAVSTFKNRLKPVSI
jgi:hypothetical protein